jgi:hypothetical protein
VTYIMLGGKEVQLMARAFAVLRCYLCGLQGVRSNDVPTAGRVII